MIYGAVINENQSQDSYIGEIVGGVVSGILAIVAIILLILFLKQRKKSESSMTSSSAGQNGPVKDIEAEKVPLEDSQEQKVALLPPPSHTGPNVSQKFFHSINGLERIRYTFFLSFPVCRSD